MGVSLPTYYVWEGGQVIAEYSNATASSRERATISRYAPV